MNPFPNRARPAYQAIDQLLEIQIKVNGRQAHSPLEQLNDEHLHVFRSNGSHDLFSSLELYHKQYWFRLIQTLQDRFIHLCKVMGYDRFNVAAIQFIEAHPPTDWNLNLFGRNWDQQSHISSYSTLEFEAMQLDLALHSALLAGPNSNRPLETMAIEDTLERRCQKTTGTTLLSLNWDFDSDYGATPTGFEPVTPNKLEQSQNILIFSNPKGIGQQLLSPAIAKLWNLLDLMTVGEALDQLEKEFCTTDLGQEVFSFFEKSISMNWIHFESPRNPSDP